MNKITTKINEKYVDEDGILQIKVLEGAFIDLESLKEDYEADKELTGHKEVLALFDARAFFTVTPEARNFVKNGIMDKSRLATAVLTNNLGARILMNGFMMINKPKTPFKMFSNKEDATKWLKGFRKN